MPVPRVLFAFPTAWDERQLAALPAEVRARHEVVLGTPGDDDVPWDLDVLAHIDALVATWSGRLDGITSSSDYPGAIVAAAVASALGLRGASPQAVLTAAHKYASRCVQQAVAPECVPRFALFDPSVRASWPAASSFPCFVKPVKGSFSLFARRVADEAALAEFASAPALAEFRAYYLRLFERLAQRYAPFEHGASAFLAEELVGGAQVTLEGWVQDGEAHLLGIVDTSFHPGTTSFARFDYPSQLPAAVQARMAEVALRVVRAHGLDHTLFNVELFYDPQRERIALIELNPRMCGQFADLYAKVDGTSGMEIALALACGERVRVRRGAGAFAAAASVPLRIFEPREVRRAPGPAELRALEHAHPGTLLWNEVHAGQRLAVGAEVEDGASLRYGIVNLGGRSRTDIEQRLGVLREALAYEFVPCAETTQLPPRAGSPDAILSRSPGSRSLGA